MVSRNTLRARVRINELTDELAVGAAVRLRVDSDDIREVVAAVVQYLLDEYPSQDLYIPSCAQWPVEAIRADMAAGLSVRAICRKYRMDRRTLYRLIDDAVAA